jgi:stage IV sporulation protein FB
MNRFLREYHVGSVRGTPICLHWSFALVLPFAWGVNESFLSGTVGFIAYLVMLLAHELGHLVMARRHHLPVYAVRIFPIHGLCEYQATYTPKAVMAISWGGVAAQAILFLFCCALYVPLLLVPEILVDSAATVLSVWLGINFFTALFNLLPLPGLDGYHAWGWVKPSLVRLASFRLKVPSEVPQHGSNKGKVVSIDSARKQK